MTWLVWASENIFIHPLFQTRKIDLFIFLSFSQFIHSFKQEKKMILKIGMIIYISLGCRKVYTNPYMEISFRKWLFLCYVFPKGGSSLSPPSHPTEFSSAFYFFTCSSFGLSLSHLGSKPPESKLSKTWKQGGRCLSELDEDRVYQYPNLR